MHESLRKCSKLLCSMNCAFKHLLFRPFSNKEERPSSFPMCCSQLNQPRFTVKYRSVRPNLSFSALTKNTKQLLSQNVDFSVSFVIWFPPYFVRSFLFCMHGVYTFFFVTSFFALIGAYWHFD